MTTPPPPHRTLLVGFGKLGTRLAPLLLADGGAVVALRRSARPVPDDGGAASGYVYDGSLARAVLGRLDYPTYEDGYAEMIAPR